MNPETPTSFGDETKRLDLRSMRDLLREDYKQRDRSFYTSLSSKDALELPPPPSHLPEDSEGGVDRRSFMKLMGGSAALAGLAACTRQPKELIVPYVKAPEEIVPGKPLYYATVRNHGGYAHGLMVESHMGRPTKVEGNPRHPNSRGATDSFSQSSVMDLYDPDRLRSSRKRGVPKNFKAFTEELTGALAESGSGDGVRILLPHSSSITERRLTEKILEQYPQAAVHVFDPVSTGNELKGLSKLFGKPMQSVLHLDKADVVVSLDHNFLDWAPGNVGYNADFADRRRVVEGAKRNRLYVIESSYTLTGGNADDRLPIRAGRVEAVARALAQGLGLPTEVPELTERETAFVSAMLVDLKEAGKQALVTAGPHQSPTVIALAHLINAQLMSIGTTVEYIDPILNGPEDAWSDFADLVRDMHAGKVSTLLMLDVNPVYACPHTLRFEKGLEQVAFTAHLTLMADETSEKCLWVLPGTHYLETWGDLAAYDGTLSIAQPLIAPLYDGTSSLELLSLVLGEEATAYDLVRQTWQERTGIGDDEEAFRVFWRTALHDGLIAGTQAKPWKGLRARSDVLTDPYDDPQSDFGLELVILPDHCRWDGSAANNPWQQELPAPVTTLTWDTVIQMSPATARKYKVKLTDEEVQSRTKVRPTVQVVELELDKRTLQGPVLVIPGHPDDTVTVTLGGGRTTGTVATGVGYNASSIRTVANPWIQQGASVRHLNRTHQLALTQDHFPLQADGRNLIRAAGLAQYEMTPDFPGQMGHQFDRKYTLYPEWDYSTGLQWGMVIDLNTCIGCNVCVTACQAENNIPTVGKHEVMNGRQMHWIRVDRYFEDLQNGETRLHTMPMACVHCENAPCETVCPVGATMHSSEGLNMMVYNRCIGTRYCSNNCPYKVRRFNFYKYVDDETEVLKLQRNPDVTVRLRGVMEKCTYCVQRLNLARIDANVQNREVEDGDVVVACQQACPTKAISFGNLNDAHAQVTRLKQHSLNYSILEPLNTRARTSYLGKVRNPSPALEPSITDPLVFHHGPGGHHGEHAAPEGHAPEDHPDKPVHSGAVHGH